MRVCCVCIFYHFVMSCSVSVRALVSGYACFLLFLSPPHFQCFFRNLYHLDTRINGRIFFFFSCLPSRSIRRLKG